MKNCIIVFVKYPEKGKVKIRLSKDIGTDKAVELYKTFVYDTIDKAKSIGMDVLIFSTPEEKNEETKKWIGKEFKHFIQNGRNLGMRMKNAFKAVFEVGYEKAIIIGSDSPDLPKVYLEQAFEKLVNNSIVLGPSKDGGYYLIGLNNNSAINEIFENIEWSTSGVLKNTIGSIERTRNSYYLLPEWYDIDTKEDLKRFMDNPDNKNMVTYLYEKNIKV